MVYGWAGTASDLLATDPRTQAHTLGEQHRAHYPDRASREQQNAWEHELEWLAAALHVVDGSSGWGVVLEYELPFEGGRRPDAIILAGDAVLVLEFKEATGVSRADVDQVDAYARDLQDYHSACRDRRVLPILVMVNRGGMDETFEGVRIVGPDFLPRAMQELAGRGLQIDAEAWVSGTYAPLPTLVAAARRVFDHEPLPWIKRAESAGIPQLLELLRGIVETARQQGDRHLVLITGVPGSGKTLVGLQFVHLSRGIEPDAIFLSGNDPLVDVLQDALHSKIFVRRMHDFDLEYGVRRRSLPAQRVFVFDEAQRAWDVQRMAERKNHGRSEPEILVDIVGSVPDWGVAIGLVGEGQEIYLGEEAGLDQWAEAVSGSKTSFTVHVPPHLTGIFDGLGPIALAALNLTVSLRTHRAERLQDWVSAFLTGDLALAASHAQELRDCAYDLYLTSDLLRAKRYVLRRYDEAAEKRYGLLASSKARNLRAIGIDNEFQATRRLKVSTWFNAPPSDPRSGCQLSQPVTEFQCQGLELDMPIVCWGDDLGWEAGRWTSRRWTRAARDSHKLRLNSYRVLLTRGRDGVIVFVPDNLRNGHAEAVREALSTAGATEL